MLIGWILTLLACAPGQGGNHNPTPSASPIDFDGTWTLCELPPTAALSDDRTATGLAIMMNESAILFDGDLDRWPAGWVGRTHIAGAGCSMDDARSKTIHIVTIDELDLAMATEPGFLTALQDHGVLAYPPSAPSDDELDWLRERPEGYVIGVAPKQGDHSIVIIGGSRRGALYGIIDLERDLEPFANGKRRWTAPAHVRNAPDQERRVSAERWRVYSYGSNTDLTKALWVGDGGRSFTDVLEDCGEGDCSLDPSSTVPVRDMEGFQRYFDTLVWHKLNTWVDRERWLSPLATALGNPTCAGVNDWNFCLGGTDNKAEAIAAGYAGLATWLRDRGVETVVTVTGPSKETTELFNRYPLAQTRGLGVRHVPARIVAVDGEKYLLPCATEDCVGESTTTAENSRYQLEARDDGGSVPSVWVTPVEHELLSSSVCTSFASGAESAVAARIELPAAPGELIDPDIDAGGLYALSLTWTLTLSGGGTATIGTHGINMESWEDLRPADVGSLCEDADWSDEAPRTRTNPHRELSTAGWTGAIPATGVSSLVFRVPFEPPNGYDPGAAAYIDFQADHAPTTSGTLCVTRATLVRVDGALPNVAHQGTTLVDGDVRALTKPGLWVGKGPTGTPRQAGSPGTSTECRWFPEVARSTFTAVDADERSLSFVDPDTSVPWPPTADRFVPNGPATAGYADKLRGQFTVLRLDPACTATGHAVGDVFNLDAQLQVPYESTTVEWDEYSPTFWDGSIRESFVGQLEALDFPLPLARGKPLSDFVSRELLFYPSFSEFDVLNLGWTDWREHRWDSNGVAFSNLVCALQSAANAWAAPGTFDRALVSHASGALPSQGCSLPTVGESGPVSAVTARLLLVADEIDGTRFTGTAPFAKANGWGPPGGGGIADAVPALPSDVVAYPWWYAEFTQPLVDAAAKFEDGPATYPTGDGTPRDGMMSFLATSGASLENIRSWAALAHAHRRDPTTSGAVFGLANARYPEDLAGQQNVASASTACDPLAFTETLGDLAWSSGWGLVWEDQLSDWGLCWNKSPNGQGYTPRSQCLGYGFETPGFHDWYYSQVQDSFGSYGAEFSEWTGVGSGPSAWGFMSVAARETLHTPPITLLDADPAPFDLVPARRRVRFDVMSSRVDGIAGAQMRCYATAPGAAGGCVVPATADWGPLGAVESDVQIMGMERLTTDDAWRHSFEFDVPDAAEACSFELQLVGSTESYVRVDDLRVMQKTGAVDFPRNRCDGLGRMSCRAGIDAEDACNDATFGPSPTL